MTTDRTLDKQIAQARKKEEEAEFAWREAVDVVVAAREKSDAAKKAHEVALKELVALMRQKVGDE